MHRDYPFHYARAHPLFEQTTKDLKAWIRDTIFFLLDFRLAGKNRRDDSSMKEQLLSVGTQRSYGQCFEDDDSLAPSMEVPNPFDLVSMSR
jgi:hypothetical protein